jgi:hypothetical protein
MKAQVVALALILSVSAAYAKDWYLLDAPRDQCLSAAIAAKLTRMAEVASPGRFADLVRSEGRTPTVQVVRDSAGAVIEADVHDRGSVMSWFASEAACEAAKSALEHGGSVVSPSELR